jgi:predicted membrane protein
MVSRLLFVNIFLNNMRKLIFFCVTIGFCIYIYQKLMPQIQRSDYASPYFLGKKQNKKKQVPKQISLEPVYKQPVIKKYVDTLTSVVEDTLVQINVEDNIVDFDSLVFKDTLQLNYRDTVMYPH